MPYRLGRDIYCDECIESMPLHTRVVGGMDSRWEMSYRDPDAFDSALPGPVSVLDPDRPARCANGADCVQAVDLSDYGDVDDADRFVGALVSEGISADGADRLMDRPGALAALEREEHEL